MYLKVPLAAAVGVDPTSQDSKPRSLAGGAASIGRPRRFRPVFSALKERDASHCTSGPWRGQGGSNSHVLFGRQTRTPVRHTRRLAVS